ncbi:KH_dom_type_1 domain-containing protein [Haematococcus lacustris]|uniref:Ribosomal RNA-processing protein 40 n=1 Tax=Haematococcus lacustris TaxID=44745 RepID=A0A699YUD5_HAELA|nr:KH_dom_type_1 domain-containing protein [Haematococcus lacustris]
MTSIQAVAVPGEVVLKVPETGLLRLGTGLVLQDDNIVACKAGVVKNSKGHLWLEGRVKSCVSPICPVHTVSYRVDIGSPFMAQLPQLSFEGATRRNRPNIKAGDLVYARVVQASRDIDPQLSCVDAMGRASGFGALKGGTLIHVSSALARQLLSSPPAPVLQALGNSLQFEIAVGLNGRVWVAADSSKAAVLVANAITTCEYLTATQTQTLVSRLLQGM